MSACLTVTSDLAQLSTIHRALTQLIESGVQLQISGLRISKGNNRASAPIKSPRTAKSGRLSTAAGSSSLNAINLTNPATPPPLKRKFEEPCPEDDLTSDDESDLEDDSDDSGSDLEELHEELVPLAASNGVSAASAMDASHPSA